MFYVYVLFSKSTSRYYTGQTNNIERRILEHSKGENKSTRHGSPWELIHCELVDSREQAIAKETLIKKRGAKRFLLDIEKQDVHCNPHDDG